MRTLHRYLFRNYAVFFIGALTLLTFVMSIGLLFGCMKYIARGMSAGTVFSFVMGSLPGTLSYSVPVASLITALLVFGRLSSDSEISAMRALGVSLGSIMRTPVLLGIFFFFLALYINDNVSPNSSFLAAQRRKTYQPDELASLVTPGVWTEFKVRGNVNQVWIGNFKTNDDGTRVFEDFRVRTPMSNGEPRTVQAATATIVEHEDGTRELVARDVTINPFDERNPGMLKAEQWTFNADEIFDRLQDSMGKRKEKAEKDAIAHRRPKDFFTWELLRDLAVWNVYPPTTPEEEVARSRAAATVAQRLTLAAACFCFVIIGIPLGMQNHRRESWAGLAIALAVAASFYFFCITGESLAKKQGLVAAAIVFLPVPVCLVLSTCLIRRNN